MDAAGNLLFTDEGQVQVLAARTGTFYRTAMKAGHIYSIAYGGSIGVA